MPFDFDDDQMSEQDQSNQPPQQETPPPVKPQAVHGPRPKEPEEMDEIELKMAKAQYYWELMGTELLDTSDPLAEEVQNEVYQFLRQKLSELMGSGGTKRRKKAAVVSEKQLWRPTEAVKRTLRHPAAKKWARPARVTEAVPVGSTETGEEIVQSVTAPDGSIFERVYRKYVDNDSQRVYYRAYVKDVTGKLVSDGNKYELAINSSGGQYFRVWSQQTLPPNTKNSIQTKQQLESESNAHAMASLAALRTSLDDNGGIGKLLGAAISLAQKEE